MATFSAFLLSESDHFDPCPTCIEYAYCDKPQGDGPTRQNILTLLSEARNNATSDYIGISLGNCLLDLQQAQNDKAAPFTAIEIANADTLRAIGYCDSGHVELNEQVELALPYRTNWSNNICMPDTISMAMGYWWRRKEKDFSTLRKAIEFLHPSYIEDFDCYKKNGLGYPLGTFLMQSETFSSFVDFIFGVFKELPPESRDRKDISWPETFEASALVAHLLGVFAEYLNRVKPSGAVQHTPCVHFANVFNPHLEPASSENNVAVVFVSDHRYAPLTSTAIASIIENASISHNYDIIILDAGISNADQSLIEQQLTHRSNISIRFAKAGSVLPNTACEQREVSSSALPRILEHLKNYSKAIYLDSDLICKTDIAQLYSVDVSKALFAAVINPASTNTSTGARGASVSPGVLVLNISELLSPGLTESLVDISKAIDGDTAALGRLTTNTAIPLDPAWNVRAHKEAHFAPEALPELWLTAGARADYLTTRKHPKIVHFSNKSTPCFEPYSDFAWYFWKYAKKTPYYEILSAMVSASLKTTEFTPFRRPSRNTKYGPLVSVVMPVYNAAPYLRESLKSLLKQTYRNIEIICINDGSTDGSLAIIEEFAQRDYRIIAINKPNSGAGATRNMGLGLVRGKYLCFVDSDDFVEKDMLEKLVDAAESTKADAVVFGIDEYDHTTAKFTPNEHAASKGHIPVEEPFRGADIDNFYKHLIGFTVNKLYRSSFLLNLGLLFPKIGAHEDMPFTYLALSASKKTFFLDKTLYHYRRKREGSLSDATSNHYQYMFDALDCLRNGLRDFGLWNDYERIFINYALHMLIWKHQELSLFRGLEFRDECRRKWLEHFDISNKDIDYFFDEEDYAFVERTVHMPISRRIAAGVYRLKLSLQGEKR